MNPGPSGCTYLNEWEDQAHGEVGEPVDAAPHHVGGWPGGLQEDLGDEQRGDGALWVQRGGRGRAVCPEDVASPQTPWGPCCGLGPEAPGPQEERCVSRALVL